MSTALDSERPKMAKKRAEKPGLESVKLPADVMESARIVCAYTGESLSEMLGAMLRPVLDRREVELAAKRIKERGDAGLREVAELTREARAAARAKRKPSK